MKHLARVWPEAHNRGDSPDWIPAHGLDHAPVAGTCSAEAPSRPQLIAANFSAANLAITVLTNLLQGELDLTAHSAFANGRTFKTAIN